MYSSFRGWRLLVDGLLQPFSGEFDVIRLRVIANVVPSGPLSRQAGCARTAKGVQHKVVGEAVQLDQAAGQLLGEGRRVADRSGGYRWEGPYTFCQLEEIIPFDCALTPPQTDEIKILC